MCIYIYIYILYSIRLVLPPSALCADARSSISVDAGMLYYDIIL